MPRPSNSGRDIYWRVRNALIHIDPLSDWREIIKYFRYGQRQRLRFEALLAQDYYEMVDLLKLFLADLASDPNSRDPADGSDTALRDHAPRIPDRKADRYGESLSRPYEMLEVLSNQYDLNPKPRAIVFTEGEEWKAIEKLYAYHGYDPKLLGIDFRSTFHIRGRQLFLGKLAGIHRIHARETGTNLLSVR